MDDKTREMLRAKCERLKRMGPIARAHYRLKALQKIYDKQTKERYG